MIEDFIDVRTLMWPSKTSSLGLLVVSVPVPCPSFPHSGLSPKGVTFGYSLCWFVLEPHPGIFVGEADYKVCVS